MAINCLETEPETLWRAIPQPLVAGRLLLALDDSINPRTRRHILACQRTFDHAAKPNQSRWPWAQTLVTVGLLIPIHGRWCRPPMAFRFYLRRETVLGKRIRLPGQAPGFADKFAHAVAMIVRLGRSFRTVPGLVVTDSWFGNNGLFRPLRQGLGVRVDLLSRLRVNAVLYAQPEGVPGQPGRPRKYGARLGCVAELAEPLRAQAQCYQVHVYGAVREIEAADQVVMLKRLRCAVRVVWVYRRRQWVALMSTDLTLSLAQIVEFCSARWKIEAGFREIKQEIGSDADAQPRCGEQSSALLHSGHDPDVDLCRPSSPSPSATLCFREHDRICLCRCAPMARQAHRRGGFRYRLPRIRQTPSKFAYRSCGSWHEGNGQALGYDY